MAPYDVLGNIALVKFDRAMKKKEKKQWSDQFLKEHKSVRTVLEKSDKIKGRLRTPTSTWIAGEKTKEALYKENGCEFRLNIDSCYFSPRLSTERSELARLVKKGERILVMFGGVAPFAIVLAKTGKPSEVYSVELGREPSKYALENVRRNKLTGRVTIVQGNVRRVVGNHKKITGVFDRIVMARPNLEDSFLDVAFAVSAKGTWIHYYGFYHENEVSLLKELVAEKAKAAGKYIKMGQVQKAGDIGVGRFRYRVDIRVLN